MFLPDRTLVRLRNMLPLSYTTLSPVVNTNNTQYLPLGPFNHATMICPFS